MARTGLLDLVHRQEPDRVDAQPVQLGFRHGASLHFLTSIPIIMLMATSLQQYGQSIWLDFISRKMITTGELARLVRDAGVAGVTSNPTIFEKAIDGSND